MTDSILTTTKKLLGLAEDYEAFDMDIVLHINSVFTTLNDLGIGPDDGFMIADKSVNWVDYLGTDKRLNAVKSYMVLRVRMLFDPPTTSYLMDAFTKQIQELEWRLNFQRELKLADAGLLFTIDAGLPFQKRIRVRNAATIWSSTDQFEAKLSVYTLDQRSHVSDLSAYVSTSIDGTDILVDWVMTGQQTRRLSDGFYEITLSDPGPEDARAIKPLSGRIRVLTLAH